MRKELLQVLDELTQYFDEPIYIVGGAIRNYLLGYPMVDVDLAAAICPGSVQEALKNSSFTVKNASKKLFTLLISKENYCFEFTSFRTDYYTKGLHRPYKTQLVQDIKLDALRRDFTINSIYYNIKERQFVDPLLGMKDLEKRLIKTVMCPKEVFSQDGLRLMRLARIAAQLDLTIEEETFNAARTYAYLIKDIVPERIKDELNMIITADTKYGKQNAHLKGLNYLDNLNVLNHILPELTQCKGVRQRSDYHKYDVYEHILKTFEISACDIRLAALFHDIAKPRSINADGSMTGHDKKGAEMVEEIMGRLCYPKKQILETARLVSLHMYDLKCQAKQTTVRKFIQEHADIIDKLIALKRADYIASGMAHTKCNSGERLYQELILMKKEGIPLSIKNLKIDGNDLINLNIPKEKRNSLLKELLQATVVGGQMLKKEEQIKFVQKNIRF